MYSAQVIPNDPLITAKCGKKIFALPAFILESHKNAPVMQLSYDFFELWVLHKYRESLFGDDMRYYRVYDIETIGHEFWHTLWLDHDTEVKMNAKTWAFKDIEEFKATSGWLASFFLSEKEELIDTALTLHIIRCIWLMRYRKVTDVIPYYAEALIHLDILFNSGVIIYKDKKLSVNYDREIYETYKNMYLSAYEDLARVYLNKQDAWDFLFKYTIQEGKSYNAKNPELREIVNTYYEMYEKIGTQVYAENIQMI